MRALLGATCGLALACVAEGATLDLSWDTCRSTGLVKSPDPTPGYVPLWATAIGQSEPHRAYEVWIAISDAEDAVPDAWRFDAEGCQGRERLWIEHLAPAACLKCCPTYQSASPSIQIKNYQFAPEHLGLPSTTAVAVVANSYPLGVTDANALVRYHLAAFIFDHTGSSVEGESTPGVTCGGYERPLCIRAIPSRCNWITLDGTQVPFTIGRGELYFREPCDAVSAAAMTWGAIKGQYRR